MVIHCQILPAENRSVLLNQFVRGGLFADHQLAHRKIICRALSAAVFITKSFQVRRPFPSGLDVIIAHQRLRCARAGESQSSAFHRRCDVPRTM